MKRIAVLGSTGSIGTSCLDVTRALSDRLSVTALSANSSWRALAEQCRLVEPRYVVLADADIRDAIPAGTFPGNMEPLWGQEGLEFIASQPEIDTVVSAIVGAAGLRGTWAALEAGKTVALANKETLVVAGPLVTDLAGRSGSAIIPVDSEHSAVFQALQSGRPEEVRRVVLTASGGPFRTWSREQIEQATPEQALAHPTWSMGAKITIDSATMMNKALEVVEARWLFHLDAEQIDVVVHPQSIVHSFVEFVDGSVIAQLSPPDMKLPIQYALTYPDRVEGTIPRLDFSTSLKLDFEPPDHERFPALQLGFEAARRGGTCGAVLNAANEVAVRSFLDGTLSFPDIARACRAMLDAHHFDPSPTLAELIRLDQWARKETERWTHSHSRSCLTSTSS